MAQGERGMKSASGWLRMGGAASQSRTRNVTDTSDNSAEQTLSASRTGGRLREARRARGVDIQKVSRDLRIQPAYLEAIEEMRAKALPGGYLNAYLRSYATYLGLDAQAVIDAFARECGAVSQAPKQKAEAKAAPAPLIGPLVWRLSAAALAAAALGLVGWIAYNTSATGSAPSVEAAAPTNGARESLFAEASIDTPAPQIPLSIAALSQGWIEVRGADGTIFRSRTMAAGETYHRLRIGAGWTVSARDGGAFEWRVGDIVVEPLGEPGAPVYAISVDAVAARAAEKTAPALAGFGEGQASR